MVYVLNVEGKPLMPCKEAKARHLLQRNEVRVVKVVPFTIQLLYECSNFTVPGDLGVDTGSKKIGISVTSETHALYEEEVEQRNDIVELLSTRRAARKTRRNKKLRYCKPRFNNRKRSKKKGWVAPSVEQKKETHKTEIHNVYQLVPIKSITIEVASFDMQRLQADIKNLKVPEGEDYQQGEQLGFWNVREYVLWRDNHTCQCCKGKSKDSILEVHHKESRKTGGDSPDNLITLCKTCHDGHHKGRIQLPESLRKRSSQSLRDAAFMNIMRWSLYNEIKEIYEPLGIEVRFTFGYKTKYERIRNGLSKDHYIDARVISGNPKAEPLDRVVIKKKVRRHNRKIYKDKILKGGIKKRNQCSYEIYGYHRYDLVRYENRLCYINSLRERGSFLIKDLCDTKWKKEVGYKKLERVQCRGGYIQSYRIV